MNNSNKRKERNKRAPRELFVYFLSAVVFGGASSLLAPEGAIAEKPPDKSPVPLLPTEQVGQASNPTLGELIESIPTRPIAPLPSLPAASVTPSAPRTAINSATIESLQAEDTQAVSVLLRLSERRVYVYRGDTIERSYPVAIGRPGWETPTGEFEVFHQVTDPGWTNPLTGEVMDPGENNPLGDRWIAFWTDGNNLIGFHGTPNRESVGQAASHGCIRMYNEDVRELYEIVSVGTPVVVEM